MITHTTKLLCAVGLLGGSLAWADCIDGMRNTTDAEKQFFMETVNALKARVPAAPAGWTLEDRNRIAPPASVCTGSGKLPMRATYEVRYYWQDGIAELNKKNAEFSKRIAALKQLPPEKQAQFDETGRKGRDLERQARKLMADDKEAAQRMMAEARELSNAAFAIRQAHLKEIAPQIEAISKEQFVATNDVKTEIKLRLSANGYHTSLPEKAESLKVPNAAAAFATADQTVLLFGAWKREASGYRAALAQGSTTSVQALSVEALGSPQHVRQLLAGVDAASFSAILSK